MRTLSFVFATLTLALFMPMSSHAQVARFDAITDTIQIAGQTVLGTAATFEARVMLQPGGGGSIYFEQANGLEHKQLSLSETGPAGFGFTLPTNQTTFSALTLVSAGVFHHVAFVRDGGQERLYLDGSLVGSRSVSGDIDDSSNTTPAVGAQFFDTTSFMANAFIGLIDTLRISNVARYSGSSFSAPTGDLSTDASTLILYNFNAADLSANQLADLSGNGHTGTLGVGFIGATAPEITTAVPEPGTWALMLAGLLGVASLARRRQAGAVAGMGLLAIASAAHAGTAADAWDISQGSVVTQFVANPALPGNGPGMFGGDAGANSPFAIERFNTIFPDLLPADTVHSIEWQTPAPVALAGYHLEAASDGNGGRSFSRLRLLMDVAGAWVLLSDVDTSALYINNPSGGLPALDITRTFATVTAQHFRAEFTQTTSFFGQSGPRVLELDAIAAVPEPGSWALLLAGTAALLAGRRRLPRAC